ncbi:hypothetical protein JCM17823_08140 [Halorubrum gandharaense]
MSVAEDMGEIVRENTGERLRFFIEMDPETREQTVLYKRDDLEWTEERARAFDDELFELTAKKSYEAHMDAGDVTHIIKVADEMVVFTGFIADEVVVATFERGILVDLGSMIDDFREYMIENDVEFTSLQRPT